MTIEAIRKRREELREVIDEAKTKIAIAKAELEMMTQRCSHPNIRKYSAMGEIGEICDDCGYQT